MADDAYHEIYESGRYSFGRLTDTLGEMLREHARPRRRRRRVPPRRVVERAAAAQGWTGRVVAEPVASVLRVGREGRGEMLAGLRLLLTDTGARRHIFDYVRSTETRNHVSPREALADLMTLGAVRRAKAGKFDGAPEFGVSAEIDTDQRRLVIRSHAGAPAEANNVPTAKQLAALLEQRGWEFFVDHSEVSSSLAYPLIGSRSVEVPLRAGPSALPVLNWLARSRPLDVAAALSPLLPRR